MWMRVNPGTVARGHAQPSCRKSCRMSRPASEARVQDGRRARIGVVMMAAEQKGSVVSQVSRGRVLDDRVHGILQEKTCPLGRRKPRALHAPGTWRFSRCPQSFAPIQPRLSVSTRISRGRSIAWESGVRPRHSSDYNCPKIAGPAATLKLCQRKAHLDGAGHATRDRQRGRGLSVGDVRRKSQSQRLRASRATSKHHGLVAASRVRARVENKATACQSLRASRSNRCAGARRRCYDSSQLAARGAAGDSFLTTYRDVVYRKSESRVIDCEKARRRDRVLAKSGRRDPCEAHEKVITQQLRRGA